MIRNYTLAAVCAVAVLSCSDSDDTFRIPDSQPNPQTSDAPANFGDTALPGHQLESMLSEQTPLEYHQVAVLDADETSESDSGATGYDDVWYEYNSEREVQFCVEGNNDPGHYLEVLSAEGQVLANVGNGECSALLLEPGRYLKRVYLGEKSEGLIFVGASFASSRRVQSAASAGTRQPFTTPPEGSALSSAISAANVYSEVSETQIQLRRLLNLNDSSAIQTMNVSTRSCVRCNLKGIIISSKNLDGIDLELANLKDAQFNLVSMKNARFDGAQTDSAMFTDVDLTGASMRGVQLTNTTMTRANLSGVDFGTYPGQTGTFVSASSIGGANRGSKGGYITISAITDNLQIQSKLWDGNDGISWEDGFHSVGGMPVPPVSAPAMSNDGVVGGIRVGYLGNDNTIRHNWRLVGSSWNDWSSTYPPGSNSYLSGPVLSQALRSTTDGASRGYYILALSQAQGGEPEIGMHSYFYCDNEWIQRPSDTGNATCKTLFEDNNCEFGWYCILGAPDVGVDSAPAVSYLGNLDLLVTVVGTDGKLYERGFGKNNSTGQTWTAVNMPNEGNLTIVSAPDAGYAGKDSNHVLLVTSDTGTLWMGTRLSDEATYTWDSVFDSNDGEVLYGPSVDNYGRSDRVYFTAIVRDSSSAVGGSLLGDSFYYEDVSRNPSCCEKWGYPGGSATDLQASLAGSAFTDSQLALTLVDVNASGITFTDMDMTSIDLANADLSGLALSGSSFAGMDLQTVTLSGADLSGADLSNTRLDGLQLGVENGVSGCQQQDGSYLENPSVTCLAQANLTGASLHGTLFYGADLTAVTFDVLPDIDLLQAPFGGALPANYCGDEDPYANNDGSDPQSRIPESMVGNRTSLKGAHFTPSQFAPRLWRSLDLTGATISGLDSAILSQVNYSDAVMDYIKFVAPDGTRLDVSNAGFQRASLQGANVAGMDFAGSCIREARLRGIQASRTVFDNADLSQVDARYDGEQRAIFDRVSMLETKLTGGDFTGASFGNADLRDLDASGVTTFTAAQFDNAILRGANLSAALFDGTSSLPAASLKSAYLENANLNNAVFKGAQLQSAVIYGPSVSLSGTNFTEANLTGAYLRAITTSQLTLQGAILDGAVLVNAQLIDARLGQATTDSTPISSSLVGAQLDGADLSGATLTNADLSNATVCFTPPSNQADPECPPFMQLSEPYWNDATQAVDTREAFIQLSSGTNVGSTALTNATCPSGDSADQNGCDGRWTASDTSSE